MRKLLIGLLIVGVLAAAALWAAQQGWLGTTKSESDKEYSGPDIESFRLSNGMEVVLVPNHRVPAISHTLWLNIGAADDPRGKSGLAHYLEHLMFKGTPNLPSGEFSRKIEKLGGNHNAFTGRDFTGYYVNIAREHLATVMEMEADRFQHLSIPADEWEKEREVIIEERRSRIDNRPAAMLGEQMQATLFLHHPYRIPVIGWKHEMEALSLEDARKFYEYYYHPGNMLLVVAGDITRAELEPLAQQYYGVIPARKPAKRNWLSEPQAIAAREVTLRHALVQQPQWRRIYSAPSLVNGDTRHAMPLQALSYWLGDGKTSRLYQALVVEQKIATSASAYYAGLSRGPSDFSIAITPAPGVSMPQITQAVDALLQDIAAQPIDNHTLERAKTLLKASAIYARDGLQPIAQYVGYLRIIGADVSYFTKWPQLVDAITAEQVQDAARHVLRIEQSVTGYLLPPQDAAPTQTQPQPAAQEAGDE